MILDPREVQAISGVVRGKLVIGLLVLSHGAALWLGMQRHAVVADASAADAEKQTTASSPAPVDEAAELGAKLRGYAERGAARDKEEAAAKEEQPDEDALLEEARARLAADPGADLEAIVLAGTANPNAEIPMETYAAFGVWLDRDPLAAVRWFGKFMKGGRRGSFGDELGNYFLRSGFGRLGEMLEVAGSGRDEVMRSVQFVLEVRGDRDEVMSAAGLMKSAAERVDLLGNVMASPQQLAGNLAAIRASFSDADATLFLSKIWDKAGALALLDEVRAAGFPAKAVQLFEEAAKAGAGKEGHRALEDDLIWSGPNDSQSKAEEELWQGQIGPQEFYERIKAGAASGTSEAQVLQQVFDQMMRVDPRAGVAWAQQAVPDWGGLFTAHVMSKSEALVPEMRLTIAAQAWRDGVPEENDGEAVEMLIHGYESMARDDPETWHDMIAKLPAGPLRDFVEKVEEAKEEGGR